MKTIMHLGFILMAAPAFAGGGNPALTLAIQHGCEVEFKNALVTYVNSHELARDLLGDVDFSQPSKLLKIKDLDPGSHAIDRNVRLELATNASGKRVVELLTKGDFYCSDEEVIDLIRVD